MARCYITRLVSYVAQHTKFDYWAINGTSMLCYASNVKAAYGDEKQIQ